MLNLNIASEPSYIGTIYLLTSTVFLPLFASFADVFGRHWTLQLSLLLFLVGSAISTGSMNMPTMLAGRGVAGIGAAGLLAVRHYYQSPFHHHKCANTMFSTIGSPNYSYRFEVTG